MQRVTSVLDNQPAISCEPPATVWWWSYHSLACLPSYLFINNNILFSPPPPPSGFILDPPAQINHIPPYSRTPLVSHQQPRWETLLYSSCVLLVRFLRWTQPHILLSYVSSVLAGQCEGEDDIYNGHSDARFHSWQICHHHSAVLFALCSPESSQMATEAVHDTVQHAAK